MLSYACSVLRCRFATAAGAVATVVQRWENRSTLGNHGGNKANSAECAWVRASLGRCACFLVGLSSDVAPGGVSGALDRAGLWHPRAGLPTRPSTYASVIQQVHDKDACMKRTNAVPAPWACVTGSSVVQV